MINCSDISTTAMNKFTSYCLEFIGFDRVIRKSLHLIQFMRASLNMLPLMKVTEMLSWDYVDSITDTGMNQSCPSTVGFGLVDD